MISININSLLYNRVILQELRKKFGLNQMEIEIIAIIDFKTEGKDGLYCTVNGIREFIPYTIADNSFYKTIGGLIAKGFIVDIREKGFKLYKLVLSGSGEYVLKEYNRLINLKIKEAKTGKKAKKRV